MKQIVIYISFLTLCSSETYCQLFSLEKAWETDTVFFTPESAVFDNVSSLIYISNFNTEGGFRRAADTIRDECISIIDLKGKIIDSCWCDRLLGPTGITIYNGKLWVVERGFLVAIDLTNPANRQKYPIPDFGFPNDIVFDKHGKAYITDSQTNYIYQFNGESVKKWLTDSLFSGLNCLYFNSDTLIVGNAGEYSLFAVSPENKKIIVLYKNAISFVDGITIFKDRFFVSGGTKIKTLDQDGHSLELIDSGNEKEWYADFEFIPDKKILIVPTLSTNRVVAFRIK